MIEHKKYFSALARKQEMPFLCKMRQYLNDTGIKLAGGMPNPDFFPIKEATFTLKSGEVLHLPEHLMKVALQYTEPDGVPRLIENLRAMITKQLNPPHMAERGLMMTSGGNNGLYLIMNTFIDPGDCVFLQESSYPSFLSTAKFTGARLVPVLNDSHGLRPDHLQAALKNCSEGRRKVLYVVPHADNPTGNTLTKKRQEEIYSLACEYDILIVEDDPYYFLQYGSPVLSSFLSLDTEGRVLRIDTFSKTIGAGLRLGYVTADKPFTDQMLALHSLMMGHAPGLSQMIVHELLCHWGYEGFMQQNEGLKEAYKQKREIALQAATKYLTGLCEWTEPDGMFIWLKVLGMKDVTDMVVKRCMQRKVFVVPGHAHIWDNTLPSSHIRISFSLITEETADKGFQILADIIKEELQKTKAPEHLMNSHTTSQNHH